MASAHEDDEAPSSTRSLPTWWPFAALVVLGVLIRIPQLGSDIFGPHLFRQAQTLWPIRGYVRHGIDLSQTYLPVFGDQQNVPYEFPLYQGVASVPTSWGLTDVLLGARLTTLLSFEVTALLLAWLLARWSNRRTALLALALFQVLPFGLLWGTSPLIDFFSVALGLGAVVLADVYLRTGRTPALAAGAVLCWLALLVKITNFPTIGILLVVSATLAMRTIHRSDLLRRGATFLVAGPGVGAVLVMLWTRYADHVKAGDPSTAWLTSSALSRWNFGTLSQRTDPDTYRTIAARLSDQVVGPALIGIVACVVLALVLRRRRVLALGLLGALVAPPLVFFNLYVVHDYYLIAVYPVAVAMCALAIDLAVESVRGSAPVSRSTLAVALATVLCLACWATASGRYDVATLTQTVEPDPIVTGVTELTQPTDRIVTVNCDWDPALLYLSDREGYMVTSHDPDVPWQYLADQGYRYLFACGGNPSPWVPTDLRLGTTALPGLFTIDGWSG